MSVSFYRGRRALTGDSLQVNVSNSRAHDLLRALQLQWDCNGGTAEPQDFIARVVCAQAVNVPDPGSDTVVVGGDGHATLVDFGRSPGYLDHQLDRLYDLAAAAARDNDLVVWA